ncbi:FtsQ-type POTRA domain-containing protein [Microbacteriaceae bacterium VKM Ac-2854]|nr:FtsQ-type POTRA domain-containing protein [Microbacteriaceae bacterium VKM Ac-2854]
MKRPQGIEPPPPGARPVVPPRERPEVRTPAEARPHAEASTEPIAVVTPAVRRSEASRSPDEPLAHPAAERRALAKAARARRRYERGEIKRFTQRSRRRRNVLLIIGGALVALIAVVAIAAYSPLMAVRTITVEGASRVNAAEVTAALDGELGVPLTLVNRDDVAAALASFPLIQSYSVESRPPDTLLLRIVERTPVGVLESGGTFTLVDAAGVTIEQGAAAQAGYPVITTPSGNWTGDAFAAVARVMRALPADFSAQVTAASATTSDDVTLTLVSGASVVWGSAADSAVKSVVLSKLMAAEDPAEVASYDVSSPSSATVLSK